MTPHQHQYTQTLTQQRRDLFDPIKKPNQKPTTKDLKKKRPKKTIW